MKQDSIENLMKIANELILGDPMNPEPMPTPSLEEVARIQAQNLETADELQQLQNENAQLEQAAAELMNQSQVIPQATEEVAEVPQNTPPAFVSPSDVEEPEEVEEEDEEIELSPDALAQLLANVEEETLQDALNEKVASELIELGTLAKIVECAKGDLGDEFQKNAFTLIDYISQSQNHYVDGINKAASDLFSTQENLHDLFSSQGLIYTFEQLASVDTDGFFKQANEGAFDGLRMAVGNAINNAKDKIIDTAKSVTELDQIQSELAGARLERDELANQLLSDIPSHQQGQTLDRLNELNPRISELNKKRNLGRGIIGSGAALGTGAALYGGHKLYNALNGNPQDVAEEVAVLPQEKLSGTLDIESNQFGGMTKMSKEQFTYDMLKIAGAAALVTITGDENLDFALRKEASDKFDAIAQMGKAEMGESFVKVAMEIYPENQLHEIVANQHTDHLLSKVAYFIEADALSVDELEKVANAGGVMATKNVGAGLADAANNITNTIAQAKDEAEGAGRDHIGNLDGTGKAGGDIVNTLAGYSVINKPEAHGVAKTASEELEEAFMMKQAAAQAFAAADQVIKSYAKR